MSAEEAALVGRLRQILADRGVVLEPAWRYPDDEMLRVLCDVEPPYDLDEATAACEACVKMRASLPLPVSPSHISKYTKFIRLDGTSRQGEAALVVVVDRALQDQLLADAPPVLLAIYGLLERVRRDVFVTGEIETIVTVIDIGRGFRLSWHALPIGPIQQLVAALQVRDLGAIARHLAAELPSPARTAFSRAPPPSPSRTSTRITRRASSWSTCPRTSCGSCASSRDYSPR